MQLIRGLRLVSDAHTPKSGSYGPNGGAEDHGVVPGMVLVVPGISSNRIGCSSVGPVGSSGTRLVAESLVKWYPVPGWYQASLGTSTKMQVAEIVEEFEVLLLRYQGTSYF